MLPPAAIVPLLPLKNKDNNLDTRRLCVPPPFVLEVAKRQESQGVRIRDGLRIHTRA
jgi:hypothetical protein